MSSPIRPVCVNCASPVRMPEGARSHEGHVDASRDESCGTWAWREETDAEAETRAIYEAEDREYAARRDA